MSIVRDVISDAYREIHVLGYEDAADGPMMKLGVRKLNEMLHAWQADGFNLWTVDSLTVTLTTALSYTLAERPVRVHSARLVRSGVETPMNLWTRQEYDDLPVKTSTGVPTNAYFDMQRAATVMYIWPALATAAGETVKITFEREVTEAALQNGTLDVPIEFRKAVVKGLAVDLMPPMEVPATRVPTLHQEAAIAYARAMANDHEGSVYFAGPNA
jgi:hypothetical protein